MKFPSLVELFSSFLKRRQATRRPERWKRRYGARNSPPIEALESRILLTADLLEPNDSWQTATDIGIAPGIHLTQVSLHTATDQDWFRFELLRADDLKIQLNFNATAGSAGFDLFSSTANSPGATPLASSSPNSTGAGTSLAGLPVGSYFVHVVGAGTAVDYALAIDPATTSSTRVFYVNDASTTNDFYSLAAGSASNSGLTPGSPKGTIQQVLDNYIVGPNDLVLVDTGTYTTAVQATANDEGTTYAGSPGGSRLNATFEMIDSDFNLLYRLQFGGSGTGVYLHGSSVDPTTDTDLRRLTFLSSSIAIQIDGGDHNLIENSVIFGSGNYGLYMPVGGQAIVRGNTISQRSYGVFLNQGFNATLENNDLSASNFAVYGVGVYPNSASSSLDLTGNRIHGATFGVYRDWGLTTATQNEFLGNQTGFYAALGGANAALFGNSVHNNGTGLQGYGRFGGTDWSTGQANDVFSNGIGIHPADSQSVSFNRVRENVVGIQGENLGGIHHNILDGNTTAGILVSGAHDVSITNNTIHTTSGVGVKLQQSARNVSLRNNILSTDSGIGLYVATDSQQGFASDYNNHFAAGSGTPIWWEKPFGDVYDWQVEADLDLHSIGMTTLHPNLDNPLFVNPQGGDFHLQEASTSLDAGDPADLFNLEPGTNGGRVDLGAYGNTDQATESVGRYVRIEYPEYYTDWPEAVGRTILWRTYDSSATNRQVSGFVKIELFQAGIGKVADIATVPASDGSFGWSPQASGIPGTNGNRYWIQISSIDHPETVDQSREQFSIPTTGGNYYVNDASVAAGDITSAAGNNRNTGRSPQDPKANLLPLLRAYDLGPGDVVNIDAGDYIHVRNVTLSGNLTLSDDEGMTLTGPVDPNRVARLDRANPFAGASNIELDDGDYVTLEHLTLVGANLGVWAHNGSTNFQGRHLVVANNTQDGLRLESDSDGSQLDDLTAVDNGRTGIWVSTPIASLSNSVSHGNSEYGIFLQNAGDVHVENNEVYANNTGISVSNFGSGTSVIGNADLDAARGNRVHDNRQIGIAAQGSVSVVGNTVARQSTVNGIGMDITQGATARLNVVFDNTIGINSTSSAGNGAGAIDANRVFHNSTSGIRINFGTPVRQNVVYSNAIGIEGVAAYYGRYSGVVANNIVYANTTAGIRVEGAGAQIVNNTAYQPTGNAVSVELNSTNVSLRNNILWAMAGYDIAVDGTSQSGFASDFNVLQTSGAGKVALWQGAVRPSLTAWQNTIFQDANSLAHDPLFVDPVGADGVLGYNSTLHLDSGTDDDFHEQSDFGSCHGGSLAPVLSATTGLPGHLTATWVNDSQRSPGIDRGDSSDPFANEPASNGRFINLGGFGNTAQASHSPSEYMLVTRPDGGEIWPAKQTVPIRWRSHDFAGTVDIELWQVGGSTPTATIADNTPNSGEFLWLIPQATPAATNYFVKIVRNDNSLLLDQSNAPFEIAPPVSVYYVNDNSTAGDEYSTTIGDNGNTGLLPNSPKASIAAILAAYDVGPGDVIRVDTGTYVLDGNLVLRSKDSGVRIEGPQTGTAILNRGNSASGSYVVELAGADDVTISHLSLTGARDGIFAGSSSDSDRVTISQNRIYSNVDANIAIYASNDQISIIGNSVWNSTSNGASSTGITINNAASALVVGNDVYNNGTGIYASGPSLTTATQIEVRDNQVHNNSSIGIDAQHQVVVIGNSVWGQANVGSTGIRLAQPGSSAQGNSVFDNYVGFDSSSQGTSTGAIQSNRVFHNVAAGIRGYSNTLIDGNAIYGNSIGIETFKSAYVAPYIGTISHNLVYGNTNQGIRVEGNGAQVVNNTVYHLVGNAVQVETNSTNITLRNNILSVVAGGAISVNPNSEVGFSSDYNDIVLGVSGKIGRWENRDFASFADWRFDVGQDAHSQVRDPQFTDVNGFDDILGFDTSLVAGSTRVIDDGASGFSLTGSWTSVATGNQGNSVETAVSSSGGKLATWTFSGLDPNAWYEVATTWPSRSTAISDARYTLTDQQVTLATVSVNQRTSPGDFADGGVNWARLGTYLVRGSTLTVQLSNLTNASGTVSADAVRIQKLSGDHGSDDNFVPQANSPTIDAGDPATVVLGELSPNGARVNQGHTGNTPSALNSNVQQIQVLSPNGGDKIEAGQPVTVAWQSAGLSLQQPVVLLNVGGGAIGDWRANAYQTATYGTQSFTNSVDRGFVIDPAPESVYQTYAYNPAGVGSKLAWHIPTSDGTYAVRLHFVEPSYTGVGQRKFDVKLQGNTIAANFDVYAAAGARYKATVLNSTISAAGGTGIDLELVNVTSSGAILSGIELLRPNSTGVAAPTADVAPLRQRTSTCPWMGGRPGPTWPRGFRWTALDGVNTPGLPLWNPFKQSFVSGATTEANRRIRRTRHS
ncbi:MAG: right-handed parallel beta-helix repeat-containing protein [Planctomycetota bacterium]|nr:right-handed parallel beta-helix repeat-containing protein [Planctomycetota bacterium]